MKTHFTWIIFLPLLLASGALWGQDHANDPKLYYNPFSEKLVIEQTFHTTTRVSIRLVDAHGREVYEKKDQLVYPGLNKMMVSLLESLPGRYFVYINTGEKEYVKTLVTMP